MHASSKNLSNSKWACTSFRAFVRTRKPLKRLQNPPPAVISVALLVPAFALQVAHTLLLAALGTNRAVLEYPLHYSSTVINRLTIMVLARECLDDSTGQIHASEWMMFTFVCTSLLTFVNRLLLIIVPNPSSLFTESMVAEFLGDRCSVLILQFEEGRLARAIRPRAVRIASPY